MDGVLAGKDVVGGIVGFKEVDVGGIGVGGVGLEALHCEAGHFDGVDVGHCGRVR